MPHCWKSHVAVHIFFFILLARHAFQVLRSKNITYRGYQFLVLEVRVPTDGLSRSPNWCFDYRYLCEEFHRRPTACGDVNGRGTWASYSACRDKYNADMDNGDVLGCNPSYGIARLGNTVFPDLTYRATRDNSFGFYRCDTNCTKTIRGSEYGLSYMRDFWQRGTTTMYTACL